VVDKVFLNEPADFADKANVYANPPAGTERKGNSNGSSSVVVATAGGGGGASAGNSTISFNPPNNTPAAPLDQLFGIMSSRALSKIANLPLPPPPPSLKERKAGDPPIPTSPTPLEQPSPWLSLLFSSGAFAFKWSIAMVFYRLTHYLALVFCRSSLSGLFCSGAVGITYGICSTRFNCRCSCNAISINKWRSTS
jgi:hypothetical protein